MTSTTPVTVVIRNESYPHPLLCESNLVKDPPRVFNLSMGTTKTFTMQVKEAHYASFKAAFYLGDRCPHTGKQNRYQRSNGSFNWTTSGKEGCKITKSLSLYSIEIVQMKKIHIKSRM